MRIRKRPLCILTLILGCIVSIYGQSAKTKYALIFAIAHYPKENGWPQISSLRDAELMRTTLLRQGFDSSRIIVVTDSEATPKGISNAFAKLTQTIHKGDIVVVQFSCHGQRIQTDNDNKLDGLDECIVTYDAIAPSLSKDFQLDQANYCRGRQLGDYLYQIRAKLGEQGDLMVFLDYCHSGSGTRGLAKTRGGQPPWIPGVKSAVKQNLSDSSQLSKKMNVSATEGIKLSPYVVISATKPDELDSETTDDSGQGVGSLTYAVVNSFEKLNVGTTYRTLFANIQTVMNTKVPQQHPLLEGNGTDRIIMGGVFVEQKPYFEIQKILPENKLLINAGLLSGLDTGMEISLYPKGTLDPAKGNLISSGKITHSDNFHCIALLNKIPQQEESISGWIFCSSHHYRTDPVQILLIQPKQNNNLASEGNKWMADTRSMLQNLDYVRFDSNPELLITHSSKADTIKLADNGYLFAIIPAGNDNADKLKEKIRQYTQYKFLQLLDLKSDDISMEVKLVPVVNGKADTAKISAHLKNGLYEFSNGDQFVLSIKNTGQRNAYINILDMQPDGIINPILPNREHFLYPYKLKLNAGESRLLTKFPILVSPPFGTEIFKIFVSPKEMDLETATRQRGLSNGESATVMDKIVGNSYSGSRGSQSQDTNISDASTFNLIFRIKP